MGKRLADVEVLMVPGWNNSGAEHWQTRWEGRLSTVSRVKQRDWSNPVRDEWVATLISAVEAANRPVVLVAHSLGVIACVHAAALFKPGTVIGAFLVAPVGETAIEREDAIDRHFMPIPRLKLPFPAVVVAGHDDAFCPFLDAEEYAYAWGAELVDAGQSGHLNVDSGHGPWPEGLMRFAGFLAKL